MRFTSYAPLGMFNSDERPGSADAAASAQGARYLAELVERSLEVFGYLRRDHLRGRKIVRVLQRLVAQPEDVQ
jgi:hypothetical protein